MPDISMCNDHNCPSAKKCYRHQAIPWQYQTYMDFERKPWQDKCDDGYWEKSK